MPQAPRGSQPGICCELPALIEAIQPLTNQPYEGLHKGAPETLSRTPSHKTPKGGDPAAPSGTATLLRLLPPRRGWVRPTHPGKPRESRPHPAPARVKRRAVCARSRDVFTARC